MPIVIPLYALFQSALARLARCGNTLCGVSVATMLAQSHLTFHLFNWFSIYPDLNLKEHEHSIETRFNFQVVMRLCPKTHAAVLSKQRHLEKCLRRVTDALGFVGSQSGIWSSIAVMLLA